MTHGYPGFTKSYVLFELPCAEGWAFLAWLRENDPWFPVDRDSEGYISQEIDRLLPDN